MTTATMSIRPVRSVGLVSLGHGINHYLILLLPPLFPVWTTEFGVNYAELGILMAVGGVVAMVMQMPVGVLCDRVPARYMLVAGMVLLGLSVLGMGFATSYWQLAFLMIANALGNTVFHPANYSILSATVPPRWLGRAFSVHTFAGHVGFAVAPAVIGLALVWWDWRSAMITSGIIGIAMGLLYLVNGRDLKDEREAGHVKPRADGKKPPLLSGISLLMSAPMMMCFLFFLMISIAHIGFDSFLPAALYEHHGTPLATANFALSIFFAASAVGILIGGLVADHTHHHGAVAAFCFGVAAVLVVLVVQIDAGTVGMLLLVGAVGLTTGVVPPSRDLIVRRVTPPGETGKVFAFMTVAMEAAYVTAPPVFGWVLDTFGAAAMFWLTGALFIVAILTVGGTSHVHGGARIER
ncbi:MAG: MFS transporter [Pseudomonadota bacterium]